ncbi:MULTISPECIES: hypothetical protein [unclassified Streptomyces]|uniref:hypothetical protein n=1 Tax=unclassified Streptomyces TaxID=2593676 RepID=UPI0020240C79|nr:MULTISPECIES: hypothetical protein [unclassified Streptomyces]MCX4550633.1 hypothetical protein [Streptomyces sp. NBC_01500]WSC22077.1 hypothetical protein OIE60_21615 [Streptomyces sp. NBC_01766]
MTERSDTDSGNPIQYAALSVSALGVRARADGHSGWAAWRAIRREHPSIAWVVPLYLIVLALLVVRIGVSL